MSSSGSGSWKPIDSAPKDGTEILASDGKHTVVAQWLSSENWHETTCWFVHGWVEGTFDPKYWMPLPENPI